MLPFSRMILATINKVKQVMVVSYVGRIRPAELKQSREELNTLMADLRPGFRMLADLSQLESMGLDCRAELGRNMDLFSQGGVARVVRVIPDPTKDMGLDIMAIFHYRNHPEIITCCGLAEGIEKVLV